MFSTILESWPPKATRQCPAICMKAIGWVRQSIYKKIFFSWSAIWVDHFITMDLVLSFWISKLLPRWKSISKISFVNHRFWRQRSHYTWHCKQSNIFIFSKLCLEMQMITKTKLFFLFVKMVQINVILFNVFFGYNLINTI